MPIKRLCMVVMAFVAFFGMPVHAAPISTEVFQTYYKNPQPEKIIPGLQNYYQSEFSLNNLVATSALYGRLISAAKTNPEKIEEAIPLNKLSRDQVAHFFLIYKLAGGAYEARIPYLLKQIDSSEASKLEKILSNYGPIDNLASQLSNHSNTLSVDSGPMWADVADALWANFFVSGDPKYITALVDLFDDLSHSKGDKVNAAATMASINLSLKANARDHEKVYTHLKDLLEKQGDSYLPLTREMLTQVLNFAKRS